MKKYIQLSDGPLTFSEFKDRFNATVSIKISGLQEAKGLVRIFTGYGDTGKNYGQIYLNPNGARVMIGALQRFIRYRRRKYTILHILPHSSRGWGIKWGRSKRSLCYRDTRIAAYEEADRILKKNSGVLAIHDESGKIIKTISYGNTR